jgi:hypothetical protein
MATRMPGMSPSVAASEAPAETGAAAGAGAETGAGTGAACDAGAELCEGAGVSFEPHPAIAAENRNTAALTTKRFLLDMCSHLVVSGLNQDLGLGSPNHDIIHPPARSEPHFCNPDASAPSGSRCCALAAHLGPPLEGARAAKSAIRDKVSIWSTVSCWLGLGRQAIHPRPTVSISGGCPLSHGCGEAATKRSR